MRNVGADVSTGDTVYVDVTVEDESAITSALISFTNGSATATSPNFTYDAENKIVTFKFKITDNMAASRWEINSIAVCDAYDNDTVERAKRTQFNFSDLYFNVVVKSHSHIWADKWVNDNEYHWHICKNENCNEISGKEPHRWDNGVTTKSPTYVLEGEITYTCTDCGAIKRVTLDKLHSSGHSSNITTNDQIFADIPVNAYYAKAVEWAVKNGITNGKDNGLFGSNDPCTRGQIVTFLWRAVGSPAPKGTSTVPSDVLPGSYCYDAVAWALENGITNGFVDGTFGANNTCTRGQSVTFLYRALGTTPNTVNSFADVAANSFCTDAVAWAVENGVTNGTSATTFSPVDGCTRAQIVTFLYRAYQRV